jgi:GDP-4-dehydro-6-deoxy-D-mannose reductase
VLAPEFDVTDTEATRQAVALARPDSCIHLAAISGIPAAQSGPDAAWRVNLHGTLTLARALMAEAPACTLLFVSTADAYGSSFQRGTPLDEHAPLAPMNTYGATKAAADLALGAMVGEGLRVIRVRPFNHTGRGQSPAFVVPAFARQVARIEAGLQAPLIRVGALDPLRDFLDVRDVCAAYIQCVARDLPSGTILNLASGIPRRIGDVLAELLDIAGIVADIEVDGGRLRRSEIPTATGDAARAAHLLGWSPRIAWRQTLSDVLDDWRGRVATEA